MQRRFLTSLVALSIFNAGGIAQADSDQPAEGYPACWEQHREAQESRREGRLLEAKNSLEECLNPSCSAALRRDCDRWLTEVNELIPSLVFSAESSHGNLHQVEVWDGKKRIANELHGRPTQLDPGPHHLRFEREGCDAVEKLVVLSSGDRGRLFRVQLCSELEASTVATDDAPTRVPDAAEPDASVKEANVEHPLRHSEPAPVASPALPLLDKLLLVSGTIGAGVGIGLSIWSLAEYQSAEESCAPLCSDSDVQKLKTLSAASDVALVLSATTLAIFGVRLLHRRAELRLGTRSIAVTGAF